MRIVENRKLAAIVLAVVIVLCLFLSGGGSLAKQKAKAESVFFAASESISAELREKADTAYTMLSIGKRYDSFDEAVISDTSKAVEELREALDTQDIAQINRASRSLTDAVEDLYSTGSHFTLKGNDTEDFRYEYKNFSAADLRISHDPYNDAADQFNQVIGKFPAGLVGALRGVKALDLFLE